MSRPSPLPPAARPTRAAVRLFAVALLFLGARNEGCSFSLGANGLCAGLRLDPQRTTMHVGDGLQVQVNADACSAAAGCPCASQAVEGARWSSSAPATATVDDRGYVVARNPGSTTILVVPNSAESWRQRKVSVTVVP